MHLLQLIKMEKWKVILITAAFPCFSASHTEVEVPGDQLGMVFNEGLGARDEPGLNHNWIVDVRRYSRVLFARH